MIIAISRIEITQGMAKEKKFATGSTKDTVHSGCHADTTTDVQCLNMESTVMESISVETGIRIKMGKSL